ncbi:hypothetical protein QQF64_026584 [Cirrhinus molitorella]|uniref:Uncharacterized protein n=2 Tax=Cirrhinus molitorella TaxID=172907 RepID=A0ABR3NA11_9TELE|nr:hypothetical protein Q8A67_003113 [Cirrhinus molitorella]
MEELLSTFLNTSGNITSQWPHPIPELNLTNLSGEEKMQKAQCGLNFMQKALKLIHQHQSRIHQSMNLFTEIKDTNHTLEITKHCVQKAIGNCTNMTVPRFLPKDIYGKNLWDHKVLNISVGFLDELVKMVHHPSSKK